MDKVDKFCRDCVYSKQTRSHFPSSSSYRAQRPLDPMDRDPTLLGT